MLLNYLVKHLIFILLAFALCFALSHFFFQNEVDHFILISCTFWSVLTTAILYFSIVFGEKTKSSANILMGGLVAKFMFAISFFLIYILYTKNIKMVVGLAFVLQSFAFTGWVLFLLINYFNLKDKKDKLESGVK